MKGMKVQNELFVVYCIQLLEEENSRRRVLLRDDKQFSLGCIDYSVIFLKVWYQLLIYLNSVGFLMQHVIAESTALVQQEEDAASNKAEDALGSQGLISVRKVIERHDKCIAFVNDCFANRSLFHKVLKEDFDVFGNKNVFGFSSGKLLALFCDNIFKKGGSENLSDEAIEDTLDEVGKLLAYISDNDLFTKFYRKKVV
ncbi:unnamed protein product [Camellia sinensis]